MQPSFKVGPLIICVWGWELQHDTHILSAWLLGFMSRDGALMGILGEVRTLLDVSSGCPGTQLIVHGSQCILSVTACFRVGKCT